MSDDPKKTFEAAGKKKNTSSGDSKPNMFSLENSEPSSNPITLSALNRSSDADKKVRTGPKAVLLRLTLNMFLWKCHKIMYGIFPRTLILKD